MGQAHGVQGRLAEGRRTVGLSLGDRARGAHRQARHLARLVDAELDLVGERRSDPGTFVGDSTGALNIASVGRRAAPGR